MVHNVLYALFVKQPILKNYFLKHLNILVCSKKRLKAKTMQPISLVTSPRANPPRRSLRSRQGNAGVIINPGDGSPSVIVAQGNCVTRTCLANKCRSQRCLTCPDLLLDKSFKSNVTNRKYEVINPTGETLG